ncbi:MAG: hypothetical protein ACWGP1_08455 [Syntrophobacteria bacterium]
MVSRDRGDGLATGQPQDLASEAYLNSTSQGAGPEDARKDAHIRGRSSRLVNYPGYTSLDKDTTRTIICYRHLWEASASFRLNPRQMESYLLAREKL